MNSETRNCRNCKNDFIIEPDDFLFYEKIKEEKKERTRYDINIAFMPVFIILLTEFIVDWIQYGMTNIFPVLKISIPLIAFYILRFNLNKNASITKIDWIK